MAFTHLHVHTEYSLLDGSGRIKDMISSAKEAGMDSIAITDHGVMYGVIDFYNAAKEAGIKPIIGCEVYVAPESRFDREASKGDERYHHLILLAENNIGYANLMKLVSKGFTDGFYYKPRIDKEILREYHKGLIALSACLAGEIPSLLVKNDYPAALDAAREYVDIFGKNNFFIELQDHGIEEQRRANQGLMRIAEELGLDMVVTNDVHYVHKDDAKSHDILLCIQTGKKVGDTERLTYRFGEFYLRTEEEMREIFPYCPEAVDNTHKIADRCNVEIEFGITKLPAYDCPDGYDAKTYLDKLCQEGYDKRYDDSDKEDDIRRERLSYELSIIEKMGYVDYFLIVWDYVHYAKSHGIPVGPGRGSAAGSIVSYCLGITDIDPIKYQLLFERFLNPERVSMPDIDVDFGYEERSKVIDYVISKYGKNRVVQIITFGTLAARGVIRDVGRALDLPYAKCDMVAKLVPNELKITLDKALSQSKDLKNLYDSDKEVKNLIDISRQLEGLPRHSSIHAAGVVISKKDVDEYVPLSRGADGSITTQFTMTTLEALGLLKMDFLGLRTLNVIRDAIEQINKTEHVYIDLDSLDYDDKEVLASFGTGRTDGIFQLESAGMKSFMKELKPDSLEDIIAGISLYRPGPMDFIPRYIKGKRDKSSITYECPELEHILAPTYGCIVYQEQVMQIVRDLAGFSYGRSDLVRRAMSKKKDSVMQKERENFVYGNSKLGITGCVSRGISEEVANRIYDEMTDFAKYAFNKSHAACYAYVAYQTAYLKYYYPKEFMAALMNSVIDNASKVAEYILVCRDMEIDILPPDINESESGFAVCGDSVRFGLSAIKGVGKAVAEEIITERDAHGPYNTMQNFTERLTTKEVNKKTLENFIKSGAFDGLEKNRRSMIYTMPDMIDSKSHQKNKIEGQLNLFDIADDESKKSFRMPVADVEEYPHDEILKFEKETLGVYISGHPLDEYEQLWKNTITATSSDFVIDEEIGRARVEDNQICVIGGIVESITKKVTKNGDTMAFATIEDLVGSVEVLIFPKTYDKCRDIAIEGAMIFVSGRVSTGDDTMAKVICQNIIPFDKVPKYVWLRFDNRAAYDTLEKKLSELIQTSHGNDEIYIYLDKEKQKKKLPANQNIKADDNMIRCIQALIGPENVKITFAKIKS